ncbi:uncharacterized protein GGS25DRAFT_494227 [Hypoxylon fragiforme]|uniref:uncharacterized protein n=1 Tax=Hypoxylon fragiforme TaxID=63214 RepID=UPI0020C703E3|nr:uncharacterized protein GGS25DRAFT_494227 [Hypoxylon fragiforme]KAI2607066.1 hypothetical protein GGS25DRAFT_494227 [Hypoxylon fragiforme]
MPRPIVAPRSRPLCQICDSVINRRLYSTNPLLRFRNPAGSRAHYGKPQLGAKTAQPRPLVSAVLPTRNSNSTPGSRNIHDTTGERGDPVKQVPRAAPKSERAELSSITNMMTYLEKSKLKVVSDRRIPPEADVMAALQACYIVADYIMDDTVKPQITHMVNELDSTAAELLSLDSTSNSKSSELSEDTSAAAITAQVKQIIDMVSDTAYEVISHPNVFITSELLEKYVSVQARLGRPESLPQVFQLYASKPMPREAAGSISYAKQNPNRLANAIQPKIIEKALDTAIEAKNLDAAVGIIENSYSKKAFIRNKVVRQCALPLATFTAAPIAAYILATSLSGLQESMDNDTATNVAFIGILAYVGCTASIGFVAMATANDQMKRVSWAPGVPLRMRWMREDERAALDKVSCAWGFREKWRQGEEEGPDWDSLREYIGQKGMILDRTELMEGMDY